MEWPMAILSSRKFISDTNIIYPPSLGPFPFFSDSSQRTQDSIRVKVKKNDKETVDSVRIQDSCVRAMRGCELVSDICAQFQSTYQQKNTFFCKKTQGKTINFIIMTSRFVKCRRHLFFAGEMQRCQILKKRVSANRSKVVQRRGLNLAD